MRRIRTEVPSQKFGKRHGYYCSSACWSCGFCSLSSLFLYITVRLNASPFGHTTGLGTNWPLRGFYLVAFAAHLGTLTMLLRSSTAEFTRSVNPWSIEED